MINLWKTFQKERKFINFEVGYFKRELGWDSTIQGFKEQFDTYFSGPEPKSDVHEHTEIGR